MINRNDTFMSADKEKKDSASPGKNKPDRYWSLMLVGEHGRIIPIRPIKGIIISLALIFVMAILSSAAFGFLYFQQRKKLDALKNELEQSKHAFLKMKDEKDELLAQMVVSKTIATETSAPVKTKANNAAPVPGKPIPVEPRAAQEKQPIKKEAVQPSLPPVEPEKPAVQVKPAASIGDFNTVYQANRSIMRTRFRIYNKSKPKTPLSGRAVVVFSNPQQPPSQWIASPTVPLENGVPGGKAGQAFRINNFRTVEFNLFGQKPPFSVNTATIYIFSAQGDLLLKEAHELKLFFPQPSPSKSPTAPEKKESPQQAPQPRPNTTVLPEPRSALESEPEPELESEPVSEQESEPESLPKPAVEHGDSPVVAGDDIETQQGDDSRERRQ